MTIEIMSDRMLRRAGVLPDNGPAVERIRGAVDRANPAKRPMTDKQRGLMDHLLSQLKTHNIGTWAIAHAWVSDHPDMHVAQASDVITRLRNQLAGPAAGPAPVVNDKRDVWAEWRKLAAELVELGGRHGARFAVDTNDDATNRTAFWWIVPDRRNEGRFYLRQMIGGQGAVRVRMSPEAMVAIARKIMTDPKEAMLRYGREIGECGHCGRDLTNDESRARGIGPVCARNKGW